MNDGLLDGLDLGAPVVEALTAVHGGAPSPIVSGIFAGSPGVNMNGPAGEYNVGGNSAWVPDSVPAGYSPEALDGLSVDLAGFGNTYDPTFLQVSLKDYDLHGNATDNDLWNTTNAAPPLVFDRRAPGGVRWGGNMALWGHMVGNGGIYLAGHQTITSPPVDPRNQAYTIWVNPSVTIPGVPGFPSGVGQPPNVNSYGMPNYFGIASTPKVDITTNNDLLDTYGGLLAGPYVIADDVTMLGAYGTLSQVYVEALDAGVFGSPPVAVQGVTNVLGGAAFGDAIQSGGHAIGMWADISPSNGTTLTLGTILNLSAGDGSGGDAVLGGTITNLVGLAFAPSVSDTLTQHSGVQSPAVASSVIGLLIGYNNEFRALNGFGAAGTPSYALHLLGTGANGAIGMRSLTAGPPNPASNEVVEYVYKGAVSGFYYRVWQFNQGGTEQFVWMQLSNHAGTIGGGTALPN